MFEKDGIKVKIHDCREVLFTVNNLILVDLVN